MTVTQLTAKNLRDVHFGKNWTTTNLKDVLADVTWKEAITKVQDFNTIAVLTYHVCYYVPALIDVLEGRPLTAKDELSFLCPEITCEADWQKIQTDAWENAEKAASMIENLPTERLAEDFTDQKYGSYHRNLYGTIEHMYYHLGQIVILKRLIRN